MATFSLSASGAATDGVPVDADGEEGMFAVQVREDAPLATPEGLRVARADIVGRLVGA